MYRERKSFKREKKVKEKRIVVKKTSNCYKEIVVFAEYADCHFHQRESCHSELEQCQKHYCPQNLIEIQYKGQIAQLR